MSRYFLGLFTCVLSVAAATRAEQVPGGEIGPVTEQPYPIEQDDEVCGCIDLVFLVDITDSMRHAFGNITNIALPAVIDKAVVKSGGDLRVGLITFDGAGLPYNGHDWVNVVFPFTPDVAAARAGVIGLQLGPGGGAHAPEASDEALREVLDSSNCRLNGPDFNASGGFRPQCIKYAMLLTDEPPAGCND
jgi:hypothetical protein